MINSFFVDSQLFLNGAAALVFIGFYCILARRNMIRLLIGLEIISKGICLLIISGSFSTKIQLAQALVITVIVIEVCVIAIGLLLVIRAYKQTGNIDIRKLVNLKG